jgi:transcriptional regulator of acetoin/glycerol metabolism
MRSTSKSLTAIRRQASWSALRPGGYDETSEEILEALTACKGRVGGADGAATRLGLNRTTLMYRMRKFGIYAKLYS